MTDKSCPINFALLRTIDEMRGDSPEDTKLLRQMYDDAKRYITRFAWCKKVKDLWFGFGVGEIVAAFLAHIEPSQEGVDDYLWIIVGDIPPAYLVCDQAPTGRDAISVYVEEMSRWVKAVRNGKPVDDLIPVNAPPNTGTAEELSGRLAFIKQKILED